MATIQIKRNNSNAATKPSSLLVGELAGNLLDRSLFSSDGSNVFQFYTGTTKWFDTSGNANNANKLGGTVASSYATQSWVGDNYLGLGGGTINGTLTVSRDAAVPFYIKNTQATNSLNQATLRFVIGSNYGAGLLGKSADNNLYRTDASLSATYTIIDEGNYANTTDKRYIQNTGGTISGYPALLTLKATSSKGDSWLQFTDADTTELYAIGLRRPASSYGLQYRVNDNYYTILHSNNYSSYALPLSGGTMSQNSKIKWANNVQSWDDLDNGFTAISTARDNDYYAGLSFKGWYGFQIRAYGGDTDLIQARGATNTAWGTWRALIHSGNIGSYNAGSATKLATARTIWGQSFDGTGNVDGQFSLGGYLRMHSNSGELWLNYGGANDAYDLNVCGYVTRFYYGVASSYNSAMIINHTGNILMGTATDSAQREKLQVSGSILCDNIQQYDSKNGYFIGARKVGLGSTDGGALIYSYGDNPISLWTNYTERIKILGNGNVLIGTTTDNGSKLQVNGIASAGDFIAGSFSSTTSDYFTENGKNIPWYGLSTYDGYNAGVWLVGYSSIYIHTVYCRVSIGSQGMHLNHNLTVTGDGVFGSDARYKSKLQDLAVDIETIANAPVFSYKWTDREDDKVHLGTTAQYWLATNFKDAVDTSNKDFFHLNYGALGVAIGVSLAKKTVDHEERIKALEKENKELKNELKQLKQWHN